MCPPKKKKQTKKATDRAITGHKVNQFTLSTCKKSVAQMCCSYVL